MATGARVADKAGVLGTLVASFGCVACFPALGTLGAALGLGFLGRFEGVSVRYVVPAFAALVLIANLAAYRAHRSRWRALAGACGPLLALVGAFGLMGVLGLTHGFLPANLARAAFYAGLALMIVAAAWDLVHPANRACRVPAVEPPHARG